MAAVEHRVQTLAREAQQLRRARDDSARVPERALDQAGVNRISGLAQLVPSLATAGVNGVVTADSVAAISAAGVCPLSGNVWGDGNILLGGGGGDTIEGRGANDIIDGDRALHVRISYRSDPANPATEIGSISAPTEIRIVTPDRRA